VPPLSNNQPSRTIKPPVRHGNPLVRILLSLAILGTALFFVIREGKPPKKVPVAPSFRSLTPSAEGGGTFAWIPRYPGATVTGIRTHETEKELTYGLEFTSPDQPAAVAAYFERGLRGAGFTTKTTQPSATETNLHAEAASPKRTLDVGIDKVQNGTYVTVAAAQQ
jgi:hypothetical protein